MLYTRTINIQGIRWDKERIVWIGYHKNKNNNDCLLIQIPKDIVFEILTYIRRASRKQIKQYRKHHAMEKNNQEEQEKNKEKQGAK